MSAPRGSDDRFGPPVTAPPRPSEFAPVYRFAGRDSAGEPACVCTDIQDGDTIRVRIPVPFDFFAHPWLRLRGIDAPELGEPGGAEARDLMADLALGRPVWVRTFKRAGDDGMRRSFVRYLADVWIEGEGGELVDLAGRMVALAEKGGRG